MIYLIIILSCSALLAGFLASTALERARGARLFSSARAALDTHVSRLSFVAQHVDFSAFMGHALRAFLARIVHDLATGVLFFVRALERTLTRTVRYLRGRQHGLGGNPFEPFLKSTLTHMQQTFKRSRTKGEPTEESQGPH